MKKKKQKKEETRITFTGIGDAREKEDRES